MKNTKPKDTTPKVNEADTKNEDYGTYSAVMEDFRKARSYVKEHYEGVWYKCFKAYNGIRTDRGYEGVADDAIPETFAIVESLKSAIAGSKPRFKYLPLTEEQEQDTDVLNALVDFYWSQNNMTGKMLNWVGDMIIYGNGILMVSWEDDKPLIQHIPLSDFFVDPAATHMNRPEEPGYPRYAGYRYLTSLRELKSEKVADVDTGEMVDKYKNLDRVIAQSNSDEFNKDRKEQLLGSTYGKDAIKEQVEVIVYYTRHKKVMVANRDTVIFSEDNPYRRNASEVTKSVMSEDGSEFTYHQEIPEIQGFLPFAILRNYVDSNLFFARGDVEIVLPTQEALNDTSSQKRDNLAYTLNNMWSLEPRFKHLQEQIKSAPGAVLPLPKGAFSVIEKGDISPSADTEINRLTQIMRSATAADAAVQGTQQKFSRTTATEVQAQLQQASMRFTTKVQTLEDEGFAQLARILYKMVQIFVKEPKAVRIVGKRAVSWDEYDPERFTDEYEPRVVLESTSDAENAALAQTMQVAAQFSLNNPLVNQEAFLAKMYKTLFAKHMTDDDIEQLLTPPAPPIMGPDGNPIDPSLTQGDAAMTPGASEFIAGEGGRGSGGANSSSRRIQTGAQGGGGADSGTNNIRRTRASQAGTTLDASARPR